MKIVIEIDEKVYDWLKNGYPDEKDGEYAIRIISNGVPLPKNHGRLIDADVLRKDDEITKWLTINPIRTGKTVKMFSELFVKKIDNTPTIIEAESEEK